MVDPLPVTIQKRLDSLLDLNEKIRLALESDIDSDGRFQASWLIITDRQVMALNVDSSRNDIAVPLDELTKAAIEPLVGGSCLEVSTAEDTIPLIRYSQSRTDRFNEKYVS